MQDGMIFCQVPRNLRQSLVLARRLFNMNKYSPELIIHGLRFFAFPRVLAHTVGSYTVTLRLGSSRILSLQAIAPFPTAVPSALWVVRSL